MTLTTKTRISNRKQIWRHNSWWNLLGKLPMEWVTCLQNLWVEQKKKQQNKQQSTFIYNISFLGRTVLVGLFFDTCNLFKRFCESMRNACRGATPTLYNALSGKRFFLKLGLAIVVHYCRLPYPRLTLFSFSLIFGFWFSFTTSKMIEKKLSRFVLCRHNQGRWACFDMFTINTWDANLVLKTEIQLTTYIFLSLRKLWVSLCLLNISILLSESFSSFFSPVYWFSLFYC